MDIRQTLRKAENVLSRMTGMWWGTAIEAPDPSALATFYSDLLGWPIGHEEPGTAILAAPEGPIYSPPRSSARDRRSAWTVDQISDMDLHPWRTRRPSLQGG